MCGITGMAGPGINAWDIDVLQDLAYVSALRGKDSTGVFQGRSEGNNIKDLLIHKDVCDASSFMWINKNSEGFGNKKILQGVYNNFFCVHTRWATRGKVSKENAHPFEFSNIVGCHNGTLVDARYTDNEKTDSELLLKEINESPENPEKILKKLSIGSAYVIVYLNKNSGELYFIRNDKRSLFLALHAHRGVLYWASEAWMIKHMMARNNEYILDNEIIPFETNCVMRVHPQEIKSGVKSIWYKQKFTPKPLVPLIGPRGKWNQGTWSYQSQQEDDPSWFIDLKKKQDEKGKESDSSDNNGNFFQNLDLTQNLSKEKEKPSELSKEIKNSLVEKRGNLLILNQRPSPRKNSDKNTKIPKHWCCQCHKEMSLIDIYFSKKLTKSVYIHEDCLKNTSFEQNNLINNEEVRVG